MGRLTADMTRLAGEIHAGHGERRRMIQALRRDTGDLTRTVGRMQNGFRTAHAEMTRRQRRSLNEFMSRLKGSVDAFRNAFRTDLAGARAAWQGASHGIMQEARMLDLSVRPDSKAHAESEHSSPKTGQKRRRPRA